jgi:aryl-alcohol dehydrogenase (NADP+)
VRHAFEAGINFIDSADAYNKGRSEEVTGRAIAGERERWVLATKLGNQVGQGPNGGGLSRKWVMTAVEGSLRRLATDYIDIYYLHKQDHGTALEETVHALADLVRAGKIRYFGVPNYQAWRIAELHRLAREAGIGGPVVSQPYYNAMNRMPEVEHLPACAHFGMGVVPYSPLARGVLTAKYDPGSAPPAEPRAGREDRRMMQTEWRRESLELAQEIKRHAEARGTSASQFAIAWVLNNALVTGTIAEPRTFEQWGHYLGASLRTTGSIFTKISWFISA